MRLVTSVITVHPRERERERGREREREMRVYIYIERETETDRQRQVGRQAGRENSNSKTLFYKDCSLGSVKNLSNN